SKRSIGSGTVSVTVSWAPCGFRCLSVLFPDMISLHRKRLLEFPADLAYAFGQPVRGEENDLQTLRLFDRGAYQRVSGLHVVAVVKRHLARTVARRPIRWAIVRSHQRHGRLHHDEFLEGLPVFFHLVLKPLAELDQLRRLDAAAQFGFKLLNDPVELRIDLVGLST